MSDYKKTNDLTEKTTPVDADLLRLDDSADSFAWKKATIANVSTKVQADLIANSTNYNALAILMKGYKEYTFAPRQSGTDAPILYLEKDDFSVTALVATYTDAGTYEVDITSLGLGTDTERINIVVSNPVSGLIDGYKDFISAFVDSNTNLVINTNRDTTPRDGILNANSGVKISIQEMLEDT